MHPQPQDRHNNPQLEIAMQRMVEVHTEMMRVLTQDKVNCGNNEIPPGVQQVLDDHSRIVQMRSQIVASTNNSIPQDDHGEKPTKVDVEMTRQAKGRTIQELTPYGRVRKTLAKER
jgi:hypothetical protein